jgi:hypothetical protein
MSKSAAAVALAAAIVLLAPAPAGRAEITAITGRTEVQVDEYRFGMLGDTDWARDEYPETSPTLPLQVLARLISSDPNQPAAAAVAAQFADPTGAQQPNPEEFAINLTLNSASPNVRYEATAVSQETRGVRLTAEELGPPLRPGDTTVATGRVFLDGALTVFAAGPERDLTGAVVLLRVTVVKIAEGQEDQTVFSGEVALRGTAGGNVIVAAEGDFPTNRLILTDLSALSDDFGAFAVLIIPNDTAINYDYTAVVGQPFTLQATVAVEAANVAGDSGVAAVIGTPTDTLTEVIGATRDQQIAAQMLSALESERERPSGEPAFCNAPLTIPLGPLCGVMGLEGLIGVAALIGMRRLGAGHA